MDQDDVPSESHGLDYAAVDHVKVKLAMDIDSTFHRSEKSGEHFLIFLIDLTCFDALVVETSIVIDQKFETDLLVMIIETGA